MTETQRRGDSDRDAARQQRQQQFAASHGLSVANYQQRLREAQERMRHNFETEKDAQIKRGQNWTRIRMAYPKAQAENLGIDFPDFQDFLKAQGVELNLEGMTFNRSTLAGQASREGKTVDELVNEVKSLGGIVHDK